MAKIRVEWPTDDGGYRYVEAKLRQSWKGNTFFRCHGPFDEQRALVIKDDGAIIASPSWEKVGRYVSDGRGDVAFLGPDDVPTYAEARDRVFKEKLAEVF